VITDVKENMCNLDQLNQCAEKLNVTCKQENYKLNALKEEANYYIQEILKVLTLLNTPQILRNLPEKNKAQFTDRFLQIQLKLTEIIVKIYNSTDENKIKDDLDILIAFENDIILLKKFYNFLNPTEQLKLNVNIKPYNNRNDLEYVEDE